MSNVPSILNDRGDTWLAEEYVVKAALKSHAEISGLWSVRAMNVWYIPQLYRNVCFGLASIKEFCFELAHIWLRFKACYEFVLIVSYTQIA